MVERWADLLAKLDFTYHLPQKVYVGTNMRSGTSLKVSLASGSPDVWVGDHDGHWCRLDGVGGPRANISAFLQLCVALGIPSDD